MVTDEKPQVATPEAGSEDALPVEEGGQPSAPAEAVVQHAAETPVPVVPPSGTPPAAEIPQGGTDELSQARARAARAEQYAAQQALDQTIKAQQQWDAEEAAKDKKAVDEQFITPEQAQFAASWRQRQVQTYWATRQMEANLARLQQEGEVKAFIHLAHLIADEHGIAYPSPEFKELLTCKSAQAMEKKAMAIRVKKAEDAVRAAKLVPETYDRGPGAGVSGPQSEEQILERIYNHPTSRKR